MHYMVPRHREEYAEGLEDLEDIYNIEEMKNLLEDDEISSEEEAFMRGYMDY